MDETLDILIKLEFPALPSTWELGNYILSNTENYEPASPPPPQSEFIFRFNYDRSFIRYGLGAVSALFLPKLSYWYESSPTKKLDYDITSLWSSLLQHFQPSHGVPAIDEHPALPEWVRYSRDAIQRGDVKLCSTGVGGTYFVSRQAAVESEAHSEDCKPIAVYKPIDEEPGAPNNPKKQCNFVPMLPWGGGANREVAAYKIGGALAGVPETHFIMDEREEAKLGSLQKFVANDGDCSEFGANKFSIDSVHRLGIFDIMILNMDRNDENLLVQKSSSEGDWKLVPIDHTYCFPPRVSSYFNWQFWPQAKKPFSDETLAEITSINAMANAQTLLDTGIDEVSIRNVMASTLLLQRAAQRGFTLFQIASFVSGEKNDLVDLLSLAHASEADYYRQPQYFPLSSPLQRLTLFRNICDKLVESFLQKKSNVVY